MNNFDPFKELENIRSNKQISRHFTYQKSKLAKYRAELVALHNAGGSLRDLQIWLRSKKQVKAERSTISRYLKTLSEINKTTIGNNNG